MSAAPCAASDSLDFDHIAEALPPGSMDRFILFYRSVFGLTAEPAVEFPDRFGLVKSRAMRSNDGRVRLPLNISDSPGTETGRFIAAGAGAGFHHIARTQPLRSELRKGAKSAVPLADRAIGNLQQWLIGTHHGVSKDQLQVYLDEFVFRHNRRRQPMAAFQTSLGLGRHAPKLLIRRYEKEFTTTRWGLLKQPDKQ